MGVLLMTYSGCVSGSSDPPNPATRGAVTKPIEGDRQITLTFVKQIAVDKQHAPLLALKLSPAGYLATSFEYEPIELRSTSTWDLLAIKGDYNPIRVMAFAPDGRSFAAASRDRIRSRRNDEQACLWSLPTGARILELEQPRRGRITAVSFSSKGSMVATNSFILSKFLTGRGEVKLWAYPGGKLIRKWEIDDPVYAVAFSPDEAILALACGNSTQGYHVPKPGRVVLMDISNGTERLSIEVGDMPVVDVSFSFDGNLLATLDGGHHVRVWNTVNSTKAYELPRRVDAFATSPDRAWMVTGNSDGISFWDLATGAEISCNTPIWRDKEPPCVAAVSSKFVAIGRSNGPIDVWAWTIAGPRGEAK